MYETRRALERRDAFQGSPFSLPHTSFDKQQLHLDSSFTHSPFPPFFLFIILYSFLLYMSFFSFLGSFWSPMSFHVCLFLFHCHSLLFLTCMCSLLFQVFPFSCLSYVNIPECNKGTFWISVMNLWKDILRFHWQKIKTVFLSGEELTWATQHIVEFTPHLSHAEAPVYRRASVLVLTRKCGKRNNFLRM